MVRAFARPAGCVRSPCVDQSRCEACAECPPMDICPGQAIERHPKTGRVQIMTLDSCYGCLACVTVCPPGAVWTD